MNVRQILGQKPVSAVATIKSSATLLEAAGELAAKKIGALVVSESGDSVDGILSERDIVRRIAADGDSCLTQTVGDVMIRKVTTCGPADTTNAVMQIMTEGRFRHVPVVEDGKLIGVVSIGDAVKARIEEIEHENQAMEDMIKGI